MSRVGEEMVQLVETMARLRGEGGCPWDREQTHESLRPYVLEEAYEVADAIDRGDPAALREELGDLLLQVVFHAQLATEEGGFDLADVARELRLKLIRRHPHVFGEVEARDAATVIRNWERIKQEEKEKTDADPDPFATLPRAMPALMRAEKVMKRAAAFGFTWPGPDEAWQKVAEEVDELREVLTARAGAEAKEEAADAAGLGGAQDAQDAQDARGARGNGYPNVRARIQEEIGDLLIAAVNLARLVAVDPERALELATDKFIARFGDMLTQAEEQGVDFASLSLGQQLDYWGKAKGTPPGDDNDRSG